MSDDREPARHVSTGTLHTVGGALELSQGLDGRQVLLLRALPHLGAHLLWLLAAHERLLFGRLHLPDHDRGLRRRVTGQTGQLVPGQRSDGEGR